MPALIGHYEIRPTFHFHGPSSQNNDTDTDRYA